jgi:hypothetical protein
MDAHRQIYEYDKLPRMTYLCDLLAHTRDIQPNFDWLNGGTPDVRYAYA